MPNSLPPKDRYASSSGPVNRRTVRQPVVRDEVMPHASFRQRLASAQAQHKLGGLLSQRLRGQIAGDRINPAWRQLGQRNVVVVSVAAVCGLVTVLAWLQGEMAVAWVAGIGLLVAVALASWMMRSRRGGGALHGAWSDVFDAQAVLHLDAVLKRLASEVGDAHLGQLRDMADTLGRMAPLMHNTGVNEYFTQEDHFYVTQCVRRYWPDTLEAYLKVPKNAKALPSEPGGPTPDDLMSAQLDLLLRELKQREQRLLMASANSLQQQHRFLSAKTENPR